MTVLRDFFATPTAISSFCNAFKDKLAAAAQRDEEKAKQVELAKVYCSLIYISAICPYVYFVIIYTRLVRIV